MRKYHVQPRFWLFLTAIMVIAFSTSMLVANRRLSGQTETLNARTAQRDSLVAEIGDLEEEIAFVQTDEYVERAARDELGLLMPGEVRYVNSGL